MLRPCSCFSRYTAVQQALLFLQLIARQAADGQVKKQAELRQLVALPGARYKCDAGSCCSCRVAAEEVQKQGDKLVWAQNPEARLSARAHKMSKSRGNVINPDDVVHCYGADSLRLYEMFLGPLQDTKVSLHGAALGSIVQAYLGCVVLSGQKSQSALEERLQQPCTQRCMSRLRIA